MDIRIVVRCDFPPIPDRLSFRWRGAFPVGAIEVNGGGLGTAKSPPLFLSIRQNRSDGSCRFRWKNRANKPGAVQIHLHYVAGKHHMIRAGITTGKKVPVQWLQATK